MNGRHPVGPALAAAAILATGAVLSGCGETIKAPRLQDIVEELFGPAPRQQVRMAFDPDDPDRRREGVVQLSENDWGLQEPYLEGYATLLRNDEDAGVRAAAVRALAKAGPAAKPYAPEIIDALDDPAELVRWDAALALGDVVVPEAVAPLRALAVNDESSDVRAAAARSLRSYCEPSAIRTLVRCLYDESFDVRYVARNSLIHLTGRNKGYRPEDWASVVEGDIPLDTRAEEPHERPWWDWMGVTEPGEEPIREE